MGGWEFASIYWGTVVMSSAPGNIVAFSSICGWQGLLFFRWNGTLLKFGLGPWKMGQFGKNTNNEIETSPQDMA